jgi:hypothetical protein
MRLTQLEIYQQGLEALRERLGRAGMIRFLQQLEKSKGDYELERHAWVDRLTLDDLRKASKATKSSKKRRKR